MEREENENQGHDYQIEIALIFYKFSYGPVSMIRKCMDTGEKTFFILTTERKGLMKYLQIMLFPPGCPSSQEQAIPSYNNSCVHCGTHTSSVACRKC